jgi:tellurite resistance-related uncharacterized protein
VLEVEGRRSMLGIPTHCPLCDRAELPDNLRFVRSSPRWDEQTMPASLRRAHRVARGTWGRISVHSGQLHFHARTEPEFDIDVGPGSTQAIPPDVEHEVQPLGRVSFSIDFLSVCEPELGTVGDDSGLSEGNGRAMGGSSRDEGGEPACLAHLLCPECGAVLDGGSHLCNRRSGPNA